MPEVQQSKLIPLLCLVPCNPHYDKSLCHSRFVPLHKDHIQVSEQLENLHQGSWKHKQAKLNSLIINRKPNWLWSYQPTHQSNTSLQLRWMFQGWKIQCGILQASKGDLNIYSKHQNYQESLNTSEEVQHHFEATVMYGTVTKMWQTKRAGFNFTRSTVPKMSLSK